MIVTVTPTIMSGTVPEVADFCHQEAAEHIAALHNANLDAALDG